MASLQGLTNAIMGGRQMPTGTGPGTGIGNIQTYGTPTPTFLTNQYPGGGSAADFYGAVAPNAAADPSGGALNWYMRRAGATAGQNVGQAGQTLLPIGFSNLGQILASQGQTDPRAFNMQLTDIARSTAASQGGLREQLAQLGLGGSGVGLGLQAAIGQGGDVTRAKAVANEQQLAEQRKRSDLALLYDMILGPSMSMGSAERGYQSQQDAQSAQKQAAYAQAVASIAAAAAGACWVAREVYGIDNPRWLEFREWMLTQASPELQIAYMTTGPSLAAFLREHSMFKPWMRRAMDRILEG